MTASLRTKKCACPCRKPFTPKRPHQRYFSAKCRKRKFIVRTLRRTAQERVLAIGVATKRDDATRMPADSTAKDVGEPDNFGDSMHLLARTRPEFILRLAKSAENRA